jgi:hypothetical protein
MGVPLLAFHSMYCACFIFGGGFTFHLHVRNEKERKNEKKTNKIKRELFFLVFRKGKQFLRTFLSDIAKEHQAT